MNPKQILNINEPEIWDTEINSVNLSIVIIIIPIISLSECGGCGVQLKKAPKNWLSCDIRLYGLEFLNKEIISRLGSFHKP